MKKLLLVLLCLLTLSLAVSCFAEATNSSDWKLDYYVDEFKLPTDKAYVANAKPIEGTFSNSAVDDAPLTVVVIVNQSEFSFQLYENGRKVKNSGGSDRSYTIIMLDDARQKTPLSGIMKANGGELLNLDSADVETVRTAFAKNTALSFYIEEVHNPSTNYLFTVHTEGFTDKFEDLMNSIHERDYQQAVAFFEGGNYDAALKIFAELDDYKDSSEWKPKYQELKYSEAETLLAEDNLEGAIDAFSTVKDYRDAAQRLVEIYYNYAEGLFAKDEFAKAAIMFGRAGDYKDATERCRALWDQVAERKTIAVGYMHNVGLKSNGTVEVEGNGFVVEYDVDDWTDIVAVAAGLYHTVGLVSDGTVVAVEEKNEQYEKNAGQCDVSDWTDIVAVSAGDWHTVGLKTDGTVVAVGDNSYGQCDVSDWTDIIAIAAGGMHTVGLKADGTVVAVGSNELKQCNVSDWTSIVAIAAGGWHTVGLTSDGKVVAIGNNWSGYREYVAQCNVSDWTDIVAIAAGGWHTVGLKTDGTVVGVGDNGYFQLNFSAWKDIVAIAAGEIDTIGLKSDGTVALTENKHFLDERVSSLVDLKVPN